VVIKSYLKWSHVPDLMLAAEEDRSAYAYTLVPRAGQTADYIEDQLARDGLTPFAQVRGEAAPPHLRVRGARGGQGGPEDRRAQSAVAAGHRGPRRALRGRAAQLVAVVGAR
jgi:hypothetical protein